MQHLIAFEEHSGRKHPMLADAPVLPRGCEGLWADFLQLHTSRQRDGMGNFSRISFTDLDAFERVNEIKFEAWEIDAIRQADTAWMAARK